MFSSDAQMSDALLALRATRSVLTGETWLARPEPRAYPLMVAAAPVNSAAVAPTPGPR